jgi:adenylate kinase
MDLMHLDAGAALRVRAEERDESGNEVRRYMAAGEMVPDHVVIKIVRDELERRSTPGRGVLSDGFPRNVAQIAAIDEGTVPCMVRAVVWLDVPVAVVLDRLRGRAESDPRADDSTVTAEHRLEVLERETTEVRTEYANRGLLQVVDGVGDAEEVYSRLATFMSRTFEQSRR